MSLNMDAEELPTPKQAQLQKSIRILAGNFLQENMLTLQSLPSEDEYNQLQEIHKAKVQRRIAAERQEAMLAQEREHGVRRKVDDTRQKSTLSNQFKDKESKHERSDSVGAGWKPHEEIPRNSVRKVDDPMIQQMDIIRGYIKQARDATKFDEVDMLEQNLKELQQEYWRQQGAESFQT